MIQCPACRKTFQAPPQTTEGFCPFCATRLRWRYREPEPVPLTPEGEATLFDEDSQTAGPQPVCMHHNENPTVGTCRRCGCYYCEVCRTQWFRQIYCAECVAFYAASALEAAHNPKDEHRRAAIWSVIFGIVTALFVSVAAFIVLAFLENTQRAGRVDYSSMNFAMFFLLQSAGIGAIGIGQATSAIRLRGPYMILATIGLTLSGLLMGVAVAMIIPYVLPLLYAVSI